VASQRGRAGRLLAPPLDKAAFGRKFHQPQTICVPRAERGARCGAAAAPATIRYGQTFRILTANASSIAKVSLIRLATVTHAFDENGRQLRLTFTKDATGLTVTAPGSGNIAPPGYYMVFIVDGTDVPSVAKIVKIC
jgi:galactose oxidase